MLSGYIKYLSKFKWDDPTEEAAYKNVVQEQKLVMEMSAARKEREFYLSNVEKSLALSAIDERMHKILTGRYGVYKLIRPCFKCSKHVLRCGCVDLPDPNLAFDGFTAIQSNRCKLFV